MSLFRPVLAASAIASVLLVAQAASADMLFPGTKSIRYTFAVHGITAPDRAVFAYPCGTSEGAPIAELRLLENAKDVYVGSRGGSCNVYVIEKAKYDAFAKTYVPEGKLTDPKLEAFAATATKCSGAPSPLHVVSESDPRTSVHEDLDFVSDATSCTLTSRGAPQSQSTGSNGGGAPGKPASGSAPASAGPAASAGNDGGGCSAGGAAHAAAPWLVALAVPLLLGASRRRRKGGSP